MRMIFFRNSYSNPLIKANEQNRVVRNPFSLLQDKSNKIKESSKIQNVKQDVCSLSKIFKMFQKDNNGMVEQT